MGIVRKFERWFLGDDIAVKDHPTAVREHSTAVMPSPRQNLAASISVKSIREDAPKFKREYSVKIIRGILIRISIRRGYGWGLYMSGELTQPNGRWVLFDPDRIADKIIDPILLPEVETACRDIIAMDKQFRNERPDRFVDENGKTWILAA